jgi:hypothetical protein
MSTLGPKLRLSATGAFRSAIVVGVSILAMTVVRVLINGLFDGHWGADWRLAFELSAIFAGGWFVLISIYTFFKFRADEPVERILNDTHHGRLQTPMAGFVAMEYANCKESCRAITVRGPILEEVLGPHDGLLRCAVRFLSSPPDRHLDEQ